MTRFTSRKFILAAIGGLLVFANRAWDLGLSDTDMQMILGFFGSFIAAEGVTDVVTAIKTRRTESFE